MFRTKFPALWIPKLYISLNFVGFMDFFRFFFIFLEKIFSIKNLKINNSVMFRIKFATYRIPKTAFLVAFCWFYWFFSIFLLISFWLKDQKINDLLIIIVEIKKADFLNASLKKPQKRIIIYMSWCKFIMHLLKRN